MIDQATVAALSVPGLLSTGELVALATAVVTGPIGAVVTVMKMLAARLDKDEQRRWEMFQKLLDQRERETAARDTLLTKALESFSAFEFEERNAHKHLVDRLEAVSTTLRTVAAAMEANTHAVGENSEAIAEIGEQLETLERSLHGPNNEPRAPRSR